MRMTSMMGAAGVSGRSSLSLSLSLSLCAVALLALSSLTGCSIHIPVDKQTAAASYEVPKITKEAATRYQIAIVGTDVKVPEDKAVAATNAFSQLAIGRSSAAYSANAVFGGQYKGGIVDAFGQAFLHIINQKGFTTTGPFATFDDMTYPEKKDAYLAVVPSLNINFSDSGVGGYEKDGLYYSKKGTLTLSGDFFIKVIEPLTNQAFINKRINLSDLKITRQYTYEVQTTTQGADPTKTAMLKMSAPAKLTDDTNKVMQEMLNEFYSKAVEKISVYLSRAELLSLQTEVAKLKELKRF